MIGEQFQQYRIGHAAIDDGASAHTAADGCQRGLGLGDHPACNHACGGHRLDIGGLEFGDHHALGIFDTRHIRQQQKPVGLERGGDGTGGGVAVDVECLARAACTDGGDYGNELFFKEVLQHVGVHL